MILGGFTAGIILTALVRIAIAAYADRDYITAAFILKNLTYFLKKPFWITSISKILYGIISFFEISTISVTLLFT